MFEEPFRMGRKPSRPRSSKLPIQALTLACLLHGTIFAELCPLSLLPDAVVFRKFHGNAATDKNLTMLSYRLENIK
jgi:hypothetical protein